MLEPLDTLVTLKWLISCWDRKQRCLVEFARTSWAVTALSLSWLSLFSLSLVTHSLSLFSRDSLFLVTWHVSGSFACWRHWIRSSGWSLPEIASSEAWWRCWRRWISLSGWSLPEIASSDALWILPRSTKMWCLQDDYNLQQGIEVPSSQGWNC